MGYATLDQGHRTRRLFPKYYRVGFAMLLHWKVHCGVIYNEFDYSPYSFFGLLRKKTEIVQTLRWKWELQLQARSYSRRDSFSNPAIFPRGRDMGRVY